MPNYDYECKACGHGFEVFQNMSDPPLTACPKCGGAVRRLIGGGLGIIFKGSGFYVTDSKKSSAVMAPGKGSEESKSADSPSAAKEPAAKKESPKAESSKAAV